MPNLRNKVFSAIANFLIGDALGAPIELLHYDDIEKHYGIIKGLVKPVKQHPANTLKPWEVTDDSLEFIFTLKTLLKYGDKLTPEIYAKEFVSWIEESGLLSKYYIGPSTRNAIERLKKGVKPEEAGQHGYTCGGALKGMAAAIIGFKDLKRLDRMIYTVCLPTHNTCVAVSAAYAVAYALAACLRGENLRLIVEYAIRGAEKGWKKGRLISSPKVSSRIEYSIKLISRFRDPIEAARKLHDIIGCGMHSAEAVPVAIAIFYICKGDPMETVMASLNAGGDTDSIAAMAGCLAGAYSGKVISMKWLENILKTNNINLNALANSVLEKIS